jgi:hypothetical protein
MSERVTLPCSLYGEAVGLAALAAQNMGRTGPISPAPGGSPWASLLGVALLLAGISVAVAAVSALRDAPAVLGLGGLVLDVLAHRSVQPLEVGVRPCRLSRQRDQTADSPIQGRASGRGAWARTRSPKRPA